MEKATKECCCISPEQAAAILNENRCACCGDSIPEGSQVCLSCFTKAGSKGFDEGTRLAETVACRDADAAARAYEELEEKHLSECRQISEYEQENKALRRLLRRALPYIVKSCTNCDCEMLSDECKSRSDPNRCHKWKHYDEAIKLLGGK